MNGFFSVFEMVRLMVLFVDGCGLGFVVKFMVLSRVFLLVVRWSVWLLGMSVWILCLRFCSWIVLLFILICLSLVIVDLRLISFFVEGVRRGVIV